MRNINLLLLILLVGCASTPPGIKIQTQRVEVPIAIPCKATIPTKPSFNFDKLNATDDIFLKTQAILADRYLHIGYEEQLLASLRSCE